jgi:hypothetical protein
MVGRDALASDKPSLGNGRRFAKTSPLEMRSHGIVSSSNQGFQFLIVHIEFRSANAFNRKAADFRTPPPDLVVVGRAHHGVNKAGDPLYNWQFANRRGRGSQIGPGDSELFIEQQAEVEGGIRIGIAHDLDDVGSRFRNQANGEVREYPPIDHNIPGLSAALV